MKYFVKVENGQAVTGLITEENLKQVFQDLPIGAFPPPEYVVVTRTDVPKCRVTQRWIGSVVDNIDNVFIERHIFEELPANEIEQARRNIQLNHAQSGFNSWTWNEEEFCYNPPTPYPQDGKKYAWHEDSLSWIEQTS